MKIKILDYSTGKSYFCGEFSHLLNKMQPLAERMRPKSLEDYVGQQHLIGDGAVLRRMIDSGKISSFILWGPPGVGKTTLAGIIAEQLRLPFFTLSAISSGVKDIREVLEKAKHSRGFDTQAPILFIDEIHRFSKSQQDSLLSAVERGVVTLIGATTENPSFEVITPLLSRCQVYVLKPLENEDLLRLAEKAISTDYELKQRNVVLKETNALLRFSGGDARKMLNIIDLVCNAEQDKETVELTDDLITIRLQQNPSAYDKNGELHYDIISAFIKSIRGSDPDAAIYWLGRMVAGGEDPKFIARRMVIFASEDIGLAGNGALSLATACFQAVERVGMPESGLILAHTCVALSKSHKSRASTDAWYKALDLARKTRGEPVPVWLRNAPTKLMKDLGYGKGQKWEAGFHLDKNYLPDSIKDEKIFKSTL